MILVSTVLTLILNFWTIVIGKLLFSFAAGIILIAVNVYMDETIPRQLQSRFGIILNFGIITGILFELTLGLVFPDIDTEPEKAKNT